MRNVIAIFLMMITSCSAAFAEKRNTHTAFKGWELYSWQTNATWKYSLLVGTNRTKSCDEIFNKSATLTYDQLVKKLSVLAENDWVTWSDDHHNGYACGLKLPPKEMQVPLKDLCKKLNLHLQIVE